MRYGDANLSLCLAHLYKQLLPGFDVPAEFVDITPLLYT
jgi:hypothetical protein